MKAKAEPQKNIASKKILLPARERRSVVLPAIKSKLTIKNNSIVKNKPADKINNSKVLLTNHRPLNSLVGRQAPAIKKIAAGGSGFKINWPQLKLISLIVGGCLVMLGGCYGLFCTPYFRARELAISGLELLNPDEVSTKANQALNGPKWRLWQGNFWLATSRSFCRPLDEYNLISCRLKKQWPNKLTVVIREEPAIAIWQENGWNYLIDRFGRVIQQEIIGENKPKNYPIIVNQGAVGLVEDGQIEVGQGVWSLVTESQTIWVGKNPQIFNFNNDEPNSLQAVGENEQLIKLSLRRGLNQQLGLWQSGRSKFAEQLSKAKVIDLRYGDRIIYQ